MKKFALLFFLILPFTCSYSAPKPHPDLVKLLAPKLNSDRIASIFGSYGIDQIPLDSSAFLGGRISNLYSIEQGQKVMRTLAVVNFTQPIDARLKQVHAKICQGDSIGIALRNAGWNSDKIPLYFGAVALSPQIQAWMDEHQEHCAAVHIYQLNVFRENEGEHLNYCSIIEIHSPQYLDEHWLQLLYPHHYLDFREQTSQIGLLLQAAKTLMHQFPYPKEESLSCNQ